MPTPEKPARSWLDVCITLLAGLAGLYLLGQLGVVALLVAVSLPDPGRTEVFSEVPAWTTTTEVYLRNRTAAPLRVALTVARPAAAPDSVWWPLELSPEAVGQALALRDSLVIQGLHYPLPTPLLLPGTADTLIDANFDDSLPRALIHHKRYNNRPSVYMHTHRHFISPPELDPAVRLRNVPGAPDSLRLVLALTPGDSLRVARRRTSYFFNETGRLLATDGENMPYSPPYSPLDATPPYREPYDRPYPAPYRPPTVRLQWVDAWGRVRRQRPPLAALLRLPEAGATLPSAGQHLVRRYWDCR
ncbi:MAG: hypothetical protein ACRYF0_17120 [Janthinobacterium lividum]